MKNMKTMAMLMLPMLMATVSISNLSELTPTYANFTSDVGTTITAKNKQVYQAFDGSNHTVAWLKGVDAPKMTSDLDLLASGNPEYFYLDHYVDSNGKASDNFKSTYQENKGYFDVNKDIPARPIEATTCYLVAATNVLLWWLKNNESYIQTYMNHLKTDDAFGSEDGLIEVLPFIESNWKYMFQSPKMIENSQGLMSQTLGLPDELTFATKYLANFYNRGDGFATDLVWDFFINGYYSNSNHGDGLLDPNTEDNYRMDSQGGWFQPIFGKTLLTKRNTGMKVEKFNSVIKDALNNDKGIMLSFYTPQHVSTHAITIWGAEFDANENIKRIFVTDGDDFGESILKSKTALGLTTYEVTGAPGEAVRLSSDMANKDPNRGSLVQMVATLDLAQDIWEERLNDLNAPLPANISVPESVEIAKGGTRYIEANANVADTGYLTYQWYTSEKIGGEAIAINKATTNKLKVDSSNYGIKYYHCVVSNHKNGKKVNAKSNYVTVNVIDAPLINALAPTAYYVNVPSNNMFEYEVNEPTKSISISAKSLDNGTLTYQWYQTSSSLAEGGFPLKGETNPTLNINSSTAGNKFYYCLVTNTNLQANGEQSASYTPRIAIRIAVRDFAYLWAETFLNANICGSNDLTSASLDLFKQSEQSYNIIMNAKDVKHSIRYLKSTSGDEHSSDIIKQALAKYDRIIYLHGDEAGFNDYLLRKGSPAFTYNHSDSLIIENNNVYYMVIVVLGISLMVISCTSFYFINKKRKSK